MMHLRADILFTAFIIGICSFAYAGEPFLPIDSLKGELRQKLTKVATPVFHFRLEPGIDCTGAFISEKGHFITAQHCIAGCLAKHNAILRTRASEEPVTMIGAYKMHTDKMTVRQEKVDEGLTCPGHIIGDLPFRKFAASVILTGGKGWLTPKESINAFARLYPDEQKHLFDNGYENGFDFAILKIERKDLSPAKPYRCLQIAKKAPAAGAKLSTISYSCLDRKGIFADGKIALFSTGKRTTGIKESYFYKSNPKRQPAFDPGLVDRPDIIFASVDMEKCGSGSPLLNEDFEVVGIATRVYKNSTDYEFGSLEAVNISQLWQDLLDKKSGSEIKDITHCPDKKPR